MSLQDEFDQAMPRIAGSTLVPSGTYVNPETLSTTGTIAVTQTTSDGTLPAMDFWHYVPSATGSEALSAVATHLNTVLNAIGPITGNYAYTSSNLHAYSSGDLPSANYSSSGKGTGASDA